MNTNSLSLSHEDQHIQGAKRAAGIHRIFQPNELTEYLFFGLFLGLSNFFPLRWLLSSFNAYFSLSNKSDRVLLLIKSEGPFEVLSDFRLSKKTDERSILKKARWAFQLGLLKKSQFKMKADIYGIADPIVNLYV